MNKTNFVQIKINNYFNIFKIIGITVVMVVNYSQKWGNEIVPFELPL